MSSELKKRIFTSLLLLSLLVAMYSFSFIMMVALLVITIVVWIEFYALISKIFPNNK